MTVRETLRKLVPVVGAERVSHLWRAYLIGDAIQRRELEGLLEAYAAQALDDTPASATAGLFPPPPPERCIGDIDLGKVLYGGRETCLFGLRKEELLRHVGLYGSSGSGKSNGIALILDGFIQHNVPFILVDFKRTFRALLKEYPRLLVFTAGDSHTAPFQFNPMIPPPGTPVDVWMKKVIGALSHAYCQGAGSESLLVTALEQAYAEAGTLRCWPTFRDVAAVLEKQPARGRKGMWMDSAQRAVKSISTGNAAEVFCPDNPSDLSWLLNEYVILELDLLNQAEQTFLSECLLLWLIQFRMNNNARRETLQHVVIIEEAHHLLKAPPGVGDGGDPVIHIALREVRELGESIVLATQNASVVPTAVFGNQATTLAFHTKHAKDVSSTAQAMLLRDEPKDELGRLPVGEAIVRVPRWPDAFHIRLQLRPIAKGTATDLDIRQHMHMRWYSTNTTSYRAPQSGKGTQNRVPAPEEEQTKPTESPSAQAPTGISGAALSPTTTPKDEKTQASLSQVSDLEVAMLRDIVENPFDGVVQRIHRLQTSRRKGSAALKALEDRDVIKAANVYTGGAIVKLFDLTPPARALCQAHGIGPISPVTHGGVEHRYWVYRAADKLRSEGWTVKTEYQVSADLIVDVHAEKDGQTMAVLVETGKSNARKNATLTRNTGYDIVTVLPTFGTRRKSPVSTFRDEG